MTNQLSDSPRDLLAGGWRTWLELLGRLLLITVGVLIGVLSLQLFMVPFEIAPTGATGVAVIINHLTGWSIGLLILAVNVPILFLGYRYLGGWATVIGTVYAVVAYSVLLDAILPFLPAEPLSDDRLLNAIFGGVTGGISLALVMRGGATYGGTSTLAAIIQRKTGTPLSATFLYTDVGVLVVAGFVFGWESVLYAAVALFVNGLASDYMLEGPSVIRMAFIVTDRPEEVAEAVLFRLQRGVTGWESTGMYTHQQRTMLYVTISRAQVAALRDVVSAVDPKAFIVIGQGHTAYGVGFRRVVKKNHAIEIETP